MNSFAAGDIPALACIPGFHIHRVFMDSMHTVDMGVAGWVVGNTIWEIIVEEKRLGGSSQDRALELAYHAYKSFCKANSIDVTSTVWTKEKLNRKKATTFPFMKAKANETKKIVPYAWALAHEHNSGSQHDHWREAVCWGLLQYYNDIGSAGRYLSAVELAGLQSHVHTVLSCYNALNHEAQESQVR
jgi:hypothetical protein